MQAAAGAWPAATAALVAAAQLAERLVLAGEMAAEDARRLDALDALAEVLWRSALPPPRSRNHPCAEGEVQAAEEGEGQEARARGALLAAAAAARRAWLELAGRQLAWTHEALLGGWVRHRCRVCVRSHAICSLPPPPRGFPRALTYLKCALLERYAL